MATAEQLSAAIRAAEAAGDAEAAAELRAMQPESKAEGLDYARAATNALTFGFGDEIGAGFHALFAPGDYADNYRKIRDASRFELNQFRRDHPGKALAAEFLPSLATGLVGGAKLGATKLGQSIASAPLTGRMAAASAVGGTTGGVMGAGEAETMADVPGSALRAGAGGLVLGPVAELGVTGAQKIGQAATRQFRDPGTRADNIMRQVLEDAGQAPQDAAIRLAQGGPGAVIADTSEAARTKLDDLVQAPGATRDTAVPALTDRSIAQYDNITEALGPASKYRTNEALQEILENDASPLYERAFAQGVPDTPELRSIFQDLEETYPTIWKNAKRDGLFALKAKGVNISEADLGSDVTPSLRGWQAMKETLDDMSDAAARAGNNKKASAIRDMKTRLLRELDKHNSTYAEARKKWAGVMEFRETIDQAKRFMSESGEETIERLKKLSPMEEEAYRIGAIQAIRDQLSGAGFTHDTTRKFRTPKMQMKLKALFGEAGANRLYRRLDALANQQRTFNATASGSRTARAQQGVQESMAPNIGEMVNDLAQGQSARNAITGQLVRAGRNAALRALDSQTANRQARDMAGRMLMQGGAEGLQTLLRLQQPRAALPQASGAGLLAPVLFGLGGGLLTPLRPGEANR